MASLSVCPVSIISSTTMTFFPETEPETLIFFLRFVREIANLVEAEAPLSSSIESFVVSESINHNKEKGRKKGQFVNTDF